MSKRHRHNPPPRPPSPSPVSQPSAEGDFKIVVPSPAPSSADRLNDLLKQFTEMVSRLGEELSPGRITAAVERQLGVSPITIQDAVTQHRQLREDLTTLIQRLSQVHADVAALEGRATSEQVQNAIHAALRPELTRVGQQITNLTGDLSALTQRMSGGQIALDVQSAASELTKQYRGELESKLTRLREAFEFLDSHNEQLRIAIETFGPGGLPVLKQKADELQNQLDTERQAHDSTRKTLREREQKLTDTERDLFQLRAGQGSVVSLEELERRRKELEDREKLISAQEALSAENARLRKNLGELQGELAQHERELELALLTAQERAELGRLKDRLDDADRTRQHQERLRVRQESELRQLRVAIRDLEGQLRVLAAEKDLADKREERLRTLSDENRSLQATVEQQRVQAVKDRAARQKELSEIQDQEHRWAEEEARLKAQRVADQLRETREELAQLKGQYAELSKEAGEQKKSRVRAEAELAQVQRSLEIEKGRTAADREVLAEEQRQKEASLNRREEEARERTDLHKRDTLLRIGEREAQAMKEIDAAQQEVERMHKEARELAARRGELKTQVAALEQQQQDLRDRILPREDRLQPLKAKIFGAEELAAVADAPSEDGWLSRLEGGLDAAGFAFHPRLVRAFHTSLKIAKLAPLTVLAGISGTGKSELPRLYSELGGLSFLSIPVQPSWDSPQDLFGFFNYTDGRYKAEPLARLLYQINQGADPLGKGLTVVLLDEMNLARVEYYFAELLSRLEARRSVDPERSATRTRASVHLDLGAGEDPEALFLDERILFVGTMNEDESTMPLSAKVLDRSCVLSFPRPRDMRVSEQLSELSPRERLPASTWRSWYREPQEDENSQKLNNISETMDQLDRSFGHRLFRAIHSYIANYPAPEADSEAARKAAWEDQWSMKILPRLKGLECEDKKVRGGLNDLAALVPDRLKDAYGRARERDYFDWSGCPELYQDRAAEPHSV